MASTVLDRYLAILTPINEQLGTRDSGDRMELRDEVFREIEFLSRARSAVRCLRLVVSALRSSGPSTPSGLMADLVEIRGGLCRADYE